MQKQTNNSFSPGEHTGQWWFKKFCKGDKSLEDEGSVASLQKLTTPIERIIETDPLTTTQEVAQELSVDHFMVIQHLKQIERVKKLDMWVPYELTANQKIIILKFLLLFYTKTTNHFSDSHHFMCNGKWILYDNW